MPYIKQEKRNLFDESIDTLITLVVSDSIFESKSPAGYINYIITTLLDKVYSEVDDSYISFNEKIGILECAKLEYSRRRVAPYEDKKIKENGDVFPKKD